MLTETVRTGKADRAAGHLLSGMQPGVIVGGHDRQGRIARIACAAGAEIDQLDTTPCQFSQAMETSPSIWSRCTRTFRRSASTRERPPGHCGTWLAERPADDASRSRPRPGVLRDGRTIPALRACFHRRRGVERGAARASRSRTPLASSLPTWGTESSRRPLAAIGRIPGVRCDAVGVAHGRTGR